MSAWRDLNRPDVQTWRFEEMQRLDNVRTARWRNLLDAHVQLQGIRASGPPEFVDAARCLMADRCVDWLEAVFEQQRYLNRGDDA